jgi:Cytochrome P450
MSIFASLSIPQLLQLVFLLPIGYLFLGAVYRRYFHPLCKYPGPFFASITRWWMVKEIFSRKHEQHMRQLHKKYGSIVRISPNEVAISDPQAIKTIYSTGGGFTKGTSRFEGLIEGDWYTVWAMVEPDLFSLQDEKKHSARRRNVANAYALSTLLGMEEYVDQCSTLLLRVFEKFAKRREVVDISGWLQYYAFDVVGELGRTLECDLTLGFGKKFGFIEQGKDIGWIAMIEDILLFLTWVPSIYECF